MRSLSNLPPGVTDRMIEEQIEAPKAVAFEFEDCGVEHAQYFMGRGVAHSNWGAVYLGTGNSLREAYDDALENLASGGEYDIPKPLMAAMEKEVAEASDDLTVPDNAAQFEDATWQYVALYVR